MLLSGGALLIGQIGKNFDQGKLRHWG